GICLAFTQQLYRRGCSVLICDLRLHRDAIAWLESIRDGNKDAQSSARVVFHKTDVTDWKPLEETFEVYKREFGGVPYVVCPGGRVYEPVR
ncbi:hypothetical protein M432DRAFT_524981, partial [Thermoascus aurantiacus ATCC 26904]